MANTPSVEDIRRRAFEGVDNADVRQFYEAFEEMKEYERKYCSANTKQIRGDEAVVQLLLEYIERRSDKWNGYSSAENKSEVEAPPAPENSHTANIASSERRAQAVRAAYELLYAKLTPIQRQILDLTEAGRTRKEIASELRCGETEVSEGKTEIRLLLKEDMIRRAFECADETFFACEDETFFAKLEERQRKVFELAKNGRTPEEIADELRCSKVDVSTAKKAICQLLKDDIIRRANEEIGDEDVRRFYLYSEELKSQIRKRLRGKAKEGEVTEDVLHSVLFSMVWNARLAHLSLAEVDDEGKPALWPMVLDYIRRHCEKWNKNGRAGKRQRGEVPLASGDSGAPGIVLEDPRRPHDEEVSWNEVHARFLKRLTDRQLKILDMTRDGFTLQKIADELKCNKALVAMEKKKIRRKAEELLAT